MVKQYKTQREKIIEHLNFLIETKSDGFEYDYKQTISKSVIEIGLNLKFLNEIIEHYHNLGLIIIDKSRNSIKFNSKNYQKKGDPKIEKEMEEAFGQ